MQFTINQIPAKNTFAVRDTIDITYSIEGCGQISIVQDITGKGQSEVQINNLAEEGAVANNQKYSVPITEDMKMGSKTLTYYAKDTHGVSSTPETFDFFVLNPTTFGEIKLTRTNATAGTSITLTGKFTDIDQGKNIQFKLKFKDGTEFSTENDVVSDPSQNPQTFSITFEVPQLELKQYELEVYCIEKTKNSKTTRQEKVPFTITKAPSITLTPPQDQQNIFGQGDIVTFTVTVDDDTNGKVVYNDGLGEKTINYPFDDGTKTKAIPVTITSEYKYNTQYQFTAKVIDEFDYEAAVNKPFPFQIRSKPKIDKVENTQKLSPGADVDFTITFTDKDNGKWLNFYVKDLTDGSIRNIGTKKSNGGTQIFGSELTNGYRKTGVHNLEVYATSDNSHNDDKNVKSDNFQTSVKIVVQPEVEISWKGEIFALDEQIEITVKVTDDGSGIRI
ncbi:hypothetical protein TVAG_391820 [Trichomonas vaginalis G3]|uniref:Bap-like n=1 Tax=Trichomonas vaginalis (strain ATCC PRA-98 / G3) TaxID=412133 RepID=A2DFU5_TRIV3|nr:hypothetical protein TVAGG3_0322620 [Trichomonas vaginalis G3]EAY20798.1 hypothetical protein TVAG_391820 [Trichomonas vaginalis G3]KAI5529412.1 hypothetical protein TVAGG3_0322620 [Trichomonas vaginalis G3]|eukprot:XP_001581784.1 hypothetical protein [Trichomonas vaginalis G3]